MTSSADVTLRALVSVYGGHCWLLPEGSRRVVGGISRMVANGTSG
jgi:hypothetical protein